MMRYTRIAPVRIDPGPETSFYGSLTQRWYQSEIERDHFETREQMRRQKPTREEEHFASLSTEEIRQEYADKSRAEQQNANDAAVFKTAKEWGKAHPEMVRCESNVNELYNFLVAHGVEIPSYADLEVAYDNLRRANKLRLDNGVVQQQEQDAMRELAAQIKTNGVGSLLRSEEELYSMPLEKLRHLAAGVP